jgi:glycyl-tRNA synthetase
MGVTYGEVRRPEEYQHSKYYFEIADIPRLRQMYDLFDAEARACLESGLVLPAYDYVLKCSHTFNVLDTRGAVSVAERQAFFRRMRELARRVAEAYVEERKSLGYPLLKPQAESVRKLERSNVQTAQPANFILEIGVEELPAADVDSAREQLATRVPALLEELHLTHGGVRVAATPRRLAVFVADLSPQQPDRESLVKGPPADKAFDPSGNPTPAAQGFARKNGVDVADLQIREDAPAGGKYVFAVVKQTGRPAPEVLAEALPKLIAEIKFEKSMRWNDSGVAFSRPIRWLVALFGETVIPFEYAGVASGNVSRGLRPYDSPEIPIPSADRYFDLMRAAGIVLDKEERKASIVEQVRQAAVQVGGEALIEEDLLNEVANLVEKPTAVLGGFDPEFLQLPREVLISVMKKHQRYFPLTPPPSPSGRGDGGEGLLPHFIAIRNGDDQHLDLVRQGNEHVLGARFADANYFVREDLKHRLEDFRPKLAGLTFHTRLGSMLDKSERILKLAEELAVMLGLDSVQRSNVQRATFLAKADLATQMVTEMTSLQGIIGREYALRSGEKPEVAAAIGEQYQPVPRSKIGLVLALADRIDSLVGLFAAGLAPTGAKDPFGLRRAAIGIVQPLIEHDADFDLAEAVKKSAADAADRGHARSAAPDSRIPGRAPLGRLERHGLPLRRGGCRPGGAVEQPCWFGASGEAVAGLGRA